MEVLVGKLRVRGFLCGKCAIHIGLRHLHTRVNLALAQTTQNDLLAQLPSENGRGHALFLQVLPQAGDGQLVLRRNGFLGLVHSRLVCADAHLLGHLQLDAFGDQTLQGGFAQGRRADAGTSLLAQLLLHDAGLQAQVAVGDRLRIHQGHHKIGRDS